MHTPVIVETLRTAIGRRNGSLAGTHAAELIGRVQAAALARTGTPPSDVDHVLGGCVTQFGEQSFNVTRTGWLTAGLPWQVPCSTVDCQCGSSQQASHLIHCMIASGSIEVGIACGVEVMSRVPIGANMVDGSASVLPPGFTVDLPNRFVAAERIAQRYGITRDEADAFGARSQQRARAAQDSGLFQRAILPLEVNRSGNDSAMPFLSDECLRPTTVEGLSKLNPLVSAGIHTAGTVSQIADGASAILWMEKARARAAGLSPRARLLAHALVGTDPSLHINGPVDVTTHLLKRAGLSIRDIDIFEINEAFASVVLAWHRVFEADFEKLNVDGGSIALGHPLGATGGRLIANALDALERTDGSLALVAMCCGGAVATGSIIERLQ